MSLRVRDCENKVLNDVESKFHFICVNNSLDILIISVKKKKALLYSLETDTLISLKSPFPTKYSY